MRVGILLFSFHGRIIVSRLQEWIRIPTSFGCIPGEKKKERHILGRYIIGTGAFMNLIKNWRLIVPLTFLTILSAACGGVATETDPESISVPVTPEEVPIPAVLAEVIASPLGNLLADYVAKDNPLFSGSILVARGGEVLLSKG
jgi:hypothetical protein